MALCFLVLLLLFDCFSQRWRVNGRYDINIATADSAALFRSQSGECHDFYSYACSVQDDSTPRFQSFVVASKTMSDEMYSEIDSIFPTSVKRCLNVGQDELKSFQSFVLPLFAISYSKTALTTLIKIYQSIGHSMHIQSIGFFTINSSPNLVSNNNEVNDQQTILVSSDASLTLSDVDNYYDPDSTHQLALRIKQTMSELLNWSTNQSRIFAEQVIGVETWLLQLSQKQRIKQNQYTVQSLSWYELKKQLPLLFGILDAAGLPLTFKQLPVLFESLPLWVDLEQELHHTTGEDINKWVYYVIWRFVKNLLPAISNNSQFLDEQFRQMERKAFCTILVAELNRITLGMYIDEKYRNRKTDVIRLFEQIQQEYSKQSWLSNWQREKIQSMRLIFPVCSEVFASSVCCQFNATYIDTLFGKSNFFEAVLAFRHLRQAHMSILDRIVPWDVGTYYHVGYNAVLLPLTVLLSPLYSSNIVQLYSGLGFFIGHEMTHSLDRIGTLFDPFGHMTWKQSSFNLDQFKQCLIKQKADINNNHSYLSWIKSRFHSAIRKLFNRQSISDSLIKSPTLDEDVADSIGLQIVYKTMHRHSSIGDQERRDFFLAFAKHNCSPNNLPSNMKQGPRVRNYSPTNLRVNLSLRNLPEFKRVLRCHDWLSFPTLSCPIIE